jgi:hypothetical protein
MAAEVMASQENDWRKVVTWLTGPVPEGRRIFYQKHMSHHLIPQVGRDWILGITNVFLIRHPREVIPSLDEKFERPLLPDTGYPQQVEIFEFIRKVSGTICPIIDAADLLADPRAILSRLCAVLEVDFQDSMLSWPAGRRETDGVWAGHWYNAVEKSTGFQPYIPKGKPLPENLRSLYDECLPFYETLTPYRITA